jgi:hypothetical protein
MDDKFWNQPAWLARRSQPESSSFDDSGRRDAGAVANGSLARMVRRWSELPPPHRPLHVIVTDQQVYGLSGEIEALLTRSDFPIP